MGTPPNLLRFSVGIEHVEDLWEDLSRALRPS
jgi:cystathionine beta-lyase/cystathionine gamma-synthase